MSDWWWYALVLVVILAVALVVYARARRAGTPVSQGDDSSRDYREERETNRTSGMSDEDREWEAASLERNLQAQDRHRTPPPVT
jgi:hypothetical protein